MAPEQLRGGEVTRKVDIYAASVVLWELLAGQRLFQGENEGATLTKILLEDIMPPSVAAEKKGNLPEGSDTMKGLERLDAITMRGLQRDQGKRFDTAREMAHALEGCIPPATASEVSAWIERVASPALMRRAEEVTAIESGSFTNPRTTLDSISRNSQASRKTSDPSVAPRRGGRRRVVTAGLVGLALASITVALALHARPPASATSVVASTQPVPPPSAIPPPAPSAVTVDSTPPAPTLSASPTSSAEAPSHSLSSTKHVKPARPRPPPGCDPPYTWDDEGRKHYKPECL
jgi:eukaryotic-like serine/threonine-protein kinase